MIPRWVTVFFLLMAPVALFAAAVGYPTYLYLTTVRFEDRLLEAAVRAAIRLPEGRITTSEAAQWGTLRLTSASIQDLSGLEHFRGLTELNLSNNQITDISPLSGLSRLTTLSLSDNYISDIRPLHSVQFLETVYLERNDITSIEPLSNLPHLKSLVVSGNPRLWSLSPGVRSAVAVVANACDLRDLPEPYEFPNLELLAVSANEIHSLSKIADFPDLTLLYAEHNRVTQIDDLPSHASLSQLHLAGNSIAQISRFPYLPNLTVLGLSDNSIYFLPDISPLTSLSRLNLDKNPLSEEICRGADYYRQRGVKVSTSSCPELAPDVAPERPRETPEWLKRQMRWIQEDKNRSFAPGYVNRPSSPQDLQRHYDPHGRSIPIPTR